MLFRGEFVNALNARVSKMERDLESLNRSLKGHPFHNEIYSFHRTAEAQFQPILKIIEISRISDDALDMLFKPDLSEDFPHRDTVRAVEQLLEDPDKDVTAFEDELLRFRNPYGGRGHQGQDPVGDPPQHRIRRGTAGAALCRHKRATGGRRAYVHLVLWLRNPRDRCRRWQRVSGAERGR